jgi:ATP-binding protein involved in chromosome partitioning
MTHVEPGPAMQRPTNPLPGVKHVIAVGAGKGGVGKSTIAVLATVGLLRRGQRAALLDADVYGPSLPKLTGSESQQLEVDEQGRVLPVEIPVPTAGGTAPLKLVSMGHLIKPDDAVIWRGPMAQKYLKEFLDRTYWGELDVLIVDLPPGTGDIPLTLAQTIPLTGAIVVCTPQDVALLDAVRALRMYQKLGVPPLGIVENMSYYVCPHCGNRDEIFSHGGARKAAEDMQVPFLGALPLNIAIRAHGDAGRPAAPFTDADPHLIAALDDFVTRVEATIALQAAKATPLPQLKIT